MVVDVGAVSAVDHGAYRCAFGNDRADGVWVAEMMDAVEFLKEKDRMCRTILIVGGFVGRCDECEIGKRKASGQTCDKYIVKHPEEAVAIVERWSKEHPRKTRQSEFLKMFPNARIAPDGCIGGGCCPSDLDTTYVCPMEKSPYRSGCPECRRAYWRAEVSDNAD